jgi:glycine oxidase
LSGPDLLVIGAGPWGLATSWAAAREGARVELLDDGARPAAWVAAGMLGPWSEAADGEEDLHALMARAADAWPGFARALGAASGEDPGYRATGALLAAARPEHLAQVRRRLATLAAWGAERPWLTGSALRRLEPGLGPAVSGGADLPDEHQAEPRALLRALHAACRAAGVRVRAARATALVRRDGRVRGAAVEGGEVAAGRVVLAAGWAAGRLADGVPVRPVKGQILRLRAVGGAPLPLARTVRTPSVYLAPRDGEVVVGATMEERADVHVTAAATHELLDEALQAAPELGELELAEASAGRRPATLDGRPAIGEDPADGLVWAVGGYRHGVLLAPVAAEAACAVALGRDLPEWARGLEPARFAEREAACASG